MVLCWCSSTKRCWQSYVLVVLTLSSRSVKHDGFLPVGFTDFPGLTRLLGSSFKLLLQHQKSGAVVFSHFPIQCMMQVKDIRTKGRCRNGGGETHWVWKHLLEDGGGKKLCCLFEEHKNNFSRLFSVMMAVKEILQFFCQERNVLSGPIILRSFMVTIVLDHWFILLLL